MSTENVSVAHFRLINYLIDQVSLKLSGNALVGKMSFRIEPDGELNEDKKTFNLVLKVRVNDEGNNVILDMSIKGLFEFDTDNMDALMKYISINSPAILFPYIRAYVSNVTALSGMPPVMIPTLNVTKVGEILLKKLRSVDGLD